MDSHPADVTSPVNPADSAPMQARDPSNDGRGKRVFIVLFSAIALLIGADLVLDWTAGTDLVHVLFEGLIFTLAAGGLVHLLRQARTATTALTRDLARARADAAKWRVESQALLAGLGAAIDRQFAEWGLSAAEREVGLLLLKGLSLKEIAQARGTSERTVRQQALAAYRKAGVAGRAELSAFFLEDLLLPG